MPEVSVVMSVYKEDEELLTESVDSILDQTFGDYEIVIVIDNPDSSRIEKFVRRLVEHMKKEQQFLLIGVILD